jgi:uncharacterized membrane protein
MLHPDASGIFSPVRLEFAILYAALIGVLAPLYAMACRLASPNVFFGVTVETATPRSELGQNLSRQYRSAVYFHSAVGMLIGFMGTAAPWPSLWCVALTGGLLWQFAAVNVAYLRARRRVLPAQVQTSGLREVSLSPRRLTLPGGWLGQLVAIAPLVAAGAVLAARWNSIPLVFPSHWDVNGHANGWMHRTVGAVFLLPFTGFWITALLLSMGYLLTHHTRHPAGPLGSRMARYAWLMLQYMVLVEFVLSASFAALSLWLVPHGSAATNPALVGWAVAMPIAGTIGALTWLAWRAARLAERDHPAPAGTVSAAPVTGDGTADADWVLGMFYVSRADSAVLVPKRFGFGYTMNFGNPLSWWIMGGYLASSGAFVVLATCCGH